MLNRLTVALFCGFAALAIASPVDAGAKPDSKDTGWDKEIAWKVKPEAAKASATDKKPAARQQRASQDEKGKK